MPRGLFFYKMVWWSGRYLLGGRNSSP